MLRFGLFSICICQFAKEMSYVESLLPGFRQVGAYRPRSSSDLVRQREALSCWELFRGFKDFLLKVKSQLINPQLLKAGYLLSHSYLPSSVTLNASLVRYSRIGPPSSVL